MSQFLSNTTKKTQHELFVKHMGYNTLTEILLACASPMLLHWSRSLILINWNPKLNNKLAVVILDFFLIIFPISCLLTLGSDLIVPLLSALFFLTCSWSLVFYFRYYPKISKTHLPTLSHIFNSAFIICRFTVYILSCLMIYAIDLPICPRRFAKTESGGLGLMDVGTGLFLVLSAGSGPNDVERFKRTNDRRSILTFFLSSTLPCLTLGIFRTILLQNTNYQHSEVEYGVHWNFFYTLFVVRSFSLILFHQHIPWGRWLVNMYIPYRCAIHLSLGTIFLFLSEYVGPMLCPGLGPGWQVNGSTSNFLSSNRNNSLVLANFEGVVSLFGYLSIYFYFSCSFMLYKFILGSESPKSSTLKKIIMSVLIPILISLVILYLNGLNSISRRFANISYVAEILLLSNTLLLFMFFVGISLVQISQVLGTVCHPSIVISSVASDGMLYFLLSNLLTGIFNQCFDGLQFLTPNTKPVLTTGSFHFNWFVSLQQFFVFLTYGLCSTGPFVVISFLRSKEEKKLN